MYTYLTWKLFSHICNWIRCKYCEFILVRSIYVYDNYLVSVTSGAPKVTRVYVAKFYYWLRLICSVSEDSKFSLYNWNFVCFYTIPLGSIILMHWQHISCLIVLHLDKDHYWGFKPNCSIWRILFIISDFKITICIFLLNSNSHTVKQNLNTPLDLKKNFKHQSLNIWKLPWIHNTCIYKHPWHTKVSQMIDMTDVMGRLDKWI